jgi:hypothetical protein
MAIQWLYGLKLRERLPSKIFIESEIACASSLLIYSYNLSMLALIMWKSRERSFVSSGDWAD